MAEGGLQAMEALLALRELPTAVFCFNDMTAIGALRCLHNSGIRVPEQISVVGFDDLPIASFVEPPLTTIRQPKAEMGQRAAAMLLELMRGGGADPGSAEIRVPGTLVVRRSAKHILNERENYV
jgi:DNA-binding LacI/PurR family transcriptional regulator